MLELLAVGVGGFIGSCFRYLITKQTENLSESFPLGTLLSNVIAGFFIGFIIGLEQESIGILKKTKLFLTTGLLGGLSTFSAFSLETIELFKSENYLLAIGNIVFNLGLSLLGVILGLACAKLTINFSASPF
ncbi:MAG: fluoride efflux transporter CrcB [Methanimicrococcus sp.]|nr:fluoride efflux transporter CrcB [Methanimicrococcus sp.]